MECTPIRMEFSERMECTPIRMEFMEEEETTVLSADPRTMRIILRLRSCQALWSRIVVRAREGAEKAVYCRVRAAVVPGG